MTIVGQKRVRGDAELENFVFGAESDSDGPPSEHENGADENENDLKKSIMAAAAGKKPKITAFGESESEADEDAAEVGAAWHDPDDEKLAVGLESKNRLKQYKQAVDEDVVSGKEFQQRLRDNFTKVKGAQNWATAAEKKTDEDSDDEEAMALLRLSGAGIASTKGGILPSGQLGYVPMADANRHEKSKCVASCVKFHPNSELLTVAGLDKHLRLFHVDGEENAKLASYYFERFPITSTAFIRDGAEMILTGDRHHSFYSYDVESGQARKILSLSGRKDCAYTGVVAGPSKSNLKSSKLFAVRGPGGQIHIADQKTKHLVRSMKVTGECTALAFHPTRDVLYATTNESMIYEYDVATGRCLQKVHDTSAINITSLAVSPGSANSKSPVVMACGTSSGVVDLFDVSDGLEKNQNPFKSLMNLQTNVDTVAFHPDNQALFAASSDQPDAVKMWQRPTYTAFQNFPAPRKQKSIMHHVEEKFRKYFGYLARCEGKFCI